MEMGRAGIALTRNIWGYSANGLHVRLAPGSSEFDSPWLHSGVNGSVGLSDYA
jgi:hypothetical protein